MKKMRKLVSALLAMSMVFSVLAVSASAAVPVSKMKAEDLAYMDLESAPYALRDDILKAREEIIYGEQAWTVDGAVSIVNLKDGTTEALPEFSDLFPGWDVPVSDTVEVDFMPLLMDDNDINFEVNKAFYLHQPGVNAPDFASFIGNGRPVATYAIGGEPNKCYNIGYTNRTTGEDLGWIPNLSGNLAGAVKTQPYQMYGIRGSVYNSAYASNYRIIVTQDFTGIIPVYPAT